MFSIALISDVHSNYTALESVINHLREHFPSVNEVFCLGDLVGYGPEPKKCLEFFIRNNKFIGKIVKGNHDDYVARHFIPPQVNPIARIAIDYQIRNTPLELRWELGQLPHSLSVNQNEFKKEIILVHGSPQYPLSEYIYPNSTKQEALFDYMSNTNIDILILGHSHFPFVNNSNTDKGRKLLMVNPGSVGQPRDGDPRASYALLDLENLDAVIQRVEYDIQYVRDQIEFAGLPIELGSRLFKGR